MVIFILVWKIVPKIIFGDGGGSVNSNVYHILSYSCGLFSREGFRPGTFYKRDSFKAQGGVAYVRIVRNT